MVRLSKQTRRRSVSYKRPQKPCIKTGPKKNVLKDGFKLHSNAIQGQSALAAYIPKI